MREVGRGPVGEYEHEPIPLRVHIGGSGFRDMLPPAPVSDRAHTRFDGVGGDSGCDRRRRSVVRDVARRKGRVVGDAEVAPAIMSTGTRKGQG